MSRVRRGAQLTSHGTMPDLYTYSTHSTLLALRMPPLLTLLSTQVPLTSAWLKALNYSLCGATPQSESHFACVCTPYVFNRYAVHSLVDAACDSQLWLCWKLRGMPAIF